MLSCRKGFSAVTGVITFLIIVMVVTTTLTAETNNPSIVYREVTVEPGDTLWNIARSFGSGRDTREVVWEIRKVNDLQQATVYPGQTLLVPTVG